ncbi:histidine kinase [Micromonospora sp. WMMD1102]|uniref:sensor histidine kinase n=1 Tax=Micromonospora sp. WMMD1102 TaxID=3016105 RepID=UPI00241523EF|nr:histidine kinase [Micromonospora sp. WMMD1102]MDG4787203.1 histidine kinase [Micromonospora sp. WMMD1102]
MLSWLRWWLVAGLLALVALPVNAALGAMMFGVHPVAAVLAGIAQSAALLLLLVRLREATALQFLAVVVIAVAVPPGAASTWPLTVPGLLTLMAYVGLVAARYSGRAALVTWWASALLIPALVLLDPRGRSVEDGLLIMILYPVLAATVLGAVLMIRHWRGIRRELADARHDVEVEQSQRAVAEERTRIARELHDVVAHGMSVIHMQATSASYRIKNLDPEAEAEFGRIAADARSAMREMRQLLSVLRAEDADGELAPVPDLGGLPDLVASARRAGLPVQVRQTDAVRAAAVPERVALAAYRIIQESLSNVIRHAPGARTLIDLGLEGSDLVLSVVNETALRPAEPMETSGLTGHGLTGMRERVRPVGGSLEASARDEGGYQVTARLPIGDPR